MNTKSSKLSSNCLVTIFGSGYGLYGYIPVLIDGLEKKVCLPKKYKKKIKSRSEPWFVKKNLLLEKKILWTNNVNESIKISNQVIVSVNPSQQFDIVKRCVELGFKGHFFLEKPLAESPKKASQLLEYLSKLNLEYSINYSFCYIKRLKKFFSNKKNRKDLFLNWEFMAHHFANNLSNWKRLNKKGGGVLRFYGIHVISFLVEAGYSTIINSVLIGKKKEEPSRWEAIFANYNGENCHIVVDSCSKNNVFFIREIDGKNFLTSSDPFNLDQSQSDILDRRYTSLFKYLKDLDKLSLRKRLYKEINQVWELTERYSIFYKK